MKNLLVLGFLVLMSSVIEAQSLVQWSEPILVSTYEDGSLPKFTIPPRPRIAVTESGIVNVVWVATDVFQARAMHAIKLADEFSDPLFLAGEDFMQAWGNYGPNIAARGEEVYVVYEKNPTDTEPIVSRKSTNGGLSWMDEVEVDEFLNGNFAKLPHLAIDGQGHPHVSAYRYNGTEVTIGAMCSVNQGASYTTFVPAGEGLPGVEASPAFIVIDGNRHIVIWTQLDVSEVYHVYGALSTNNGATFNEPVILNDFLNYGAWIPVEEPEAIIKNDSLFMAWPSIEDENIIRVTAVPLNDFTAHTSYIIDQNFEPGARSDAPTIAGNNDIIGIVWENTFQENTSLYGSFATSGIQNMEPELILQDGINLKSPSLAFQDGFHLTYVDEENMSIMYMFGAVAPVNIAETPVENSLLIYPNPTNSVFKVESGLIGNYQYRLIDARGRVCKNGRNADGMNINIENLEKGIYTIEIIQEDRLKTGKLIVE